MTYLPTVRDVTGRTYFYVRVSDGLGNHEDWFLTENEVERIRERSDDKANLLPFIPVTPIPAWKRAVMRWLGVETP